MEIGREVAISYTISEDVAEAMAASAEATGISRELAARWLDVYHHELEQSCKLLSGLRAAKTSTTQLRGTLRSDNGPLSLPPGVVPPDG
jgi:hypothetical protein